MSEVQPDVALANPKDLGSPLGRVEFNGEQYLDGRASDPRELGWMRGAPVPADKRVAFNGDAFLNFPQIRWSLSHMRELLATINVRRGQDKPSLLDRGDKSAERMRRFSSCDL